VLSIERIAVSPHWGELRRGRVSPGRIEVDQPVIDLPVELLAHLVATGAKTEAPPLAAAEGQAPAAQPPAVAEPAPAPPPPDGVDGGGQTAVAADSRPPEPELPETSWLIVRGGRLRVGPAHGGGGIVLHGLHAELPFHGKPGSGVLRCDAISLAGLRVEELVVPVRWDSPQLSVRDWQPEGLPLRCRVDARCGLTGSLPFVAAGRLPVQDVEGDALGLPFDFRAEQLAGFSTVAGHLRHPSSIAGGGEFQLRKLSTGSRPGLSAGDEFDHGRLAWQLSGGVIRITDVRLLGEQLSLLGNAAAAADGRIGGVLRAVASPEGAAAAAARAGRFIPEAPDGFRPLDPPDRWLLDCRLAGSIDAPWFRAGGGPWLAWSEVQPLIETWLANDSGPGR
jgi:hypothetical protein